MIDTASRAPQSRTSGRLLGRAARAFTPGRSVTPLHETLAVGLGLTRRPGSL